MVGRFDGNKSISKLTEDLRVETLARSGWEKILNVKTATGNVLNILEHSAVIIEKEMEKAQKNADSNAVQRWSEFTRGHMALDYNSAQTGHGKIQSAD